MKVRRHRRRRCHGLRQPEVERELRTLGKRAQRYQRNDRRIVGVSTDLVAGRKHPIQIVAPYDTTQHQDAREQT